ncbi:MAG: glycosyltransferase family 4 protein [Candidatus Lokiarchaeota archaeon]
MNNILYIPTRYFPAISGAEFYIQRIAEIFQKSHSYDVKVITSNAIDFKALRNSKGKTIEKKEKYYNRVNNIPIKRFSVDYTQSFKEKLKLIRDLPSFEKLNLSDGCVKKFILNGPFLDNFIDTILNEEVPNIDLIHTTFYPYFNLVMALCLSKALNIPAVCTPFFHFSNPRYNDPQKLEVLEKFDLLVACTKIEKRELLRKLNIPSSNIEVIPMGVDFKIFDRVHKKTYKDFSFKKKFFKSIFCFYWTTNDGI